MRPKTKSEVSREYHPRFKELAEESKRSFESSDCSVKALALLCDVYYNKAHGTLAKFGRKRGRGTCINTMEDAIADLGYRTIRVNQYDIVKHYPGKHNTLSCVTSHHPNRFPKVKGKVPNNLLVVTRNHFFVIKDWETIDWSVGRSLQAHDIFHVVKNEED